MKRHASWLLSILAGTCLLATGASATSINGSTVGAPGCSVKVYRRPTGSIDTLRRLTNSWGRWVVATENMEPDPEPGETLYVLGGWNLGGKARTFEVFPNDPYLDLHLDRHTACIFRIRDSSHVDADLNAIYWTEGFAPETASVDTGLSVYWKYAVHVAFDTLQAVQGESAWIRLEKVLHTPVGDSVFYMTFPFTISKERFDAQIVAWDTVYFTRDSVEFRARDIGVQSLSLPDTADSGSVVVPQALLRNLGEVAVSDTVVMRVARAGYLSRRGFDLAPGSPGSVVFDAMTMTARGANVFVCSLPPDNNTGNDVMVETVFVRVRDAAAAGFVSPEDGDTLPPMVPVPIGVSVGNAGNVALETVAVSYLISADSAGADTEYAALDTLYDVAPGAQGWWFADAWSPRTLGRMYLRYTVSTREAGADNPANDVLRGVCFVDDSTGLAGEAEARVRKVLPTVLRAPLDLKRVKGELRDVMGRRVTGAKQGAGIYYLVLPERTRKLLLVR